MSEIITASIVLYNNEVDEVKKVINSIKKSSFKVKIILIDNSPNDSLKCLSEKDIVYIKSENEGYGSGHNKAIRICLDEDSQYHIIINPDIYFGNNVLESIREFMEKDREVGLVMPKILNVDGSCQYLCKMIPTPLDLFGRRFLPKIITKRSNEKFELRFTGYDDLMEVPYLSGCFMFIRKSVFAEIGLFDERFFMYPEDIDLSRRINEKYKTIYLPTVSVTHEHRKESYKSLKMLILHVVNIIKYFNKWGWFFDMKRKQQNKKIMNNLKR